MLTDSVLQRRHVKSSKVKKIVVCIVIPSLPSFKCARSKKAPPHTVYNPPCGLRFLSQRTVEGHMYIAIYTGPFSRECWILKIQDVKIKSTQREQCPKVYKAGKAQGRAKLSSDL